MHGRHLYEYAVIRIVPRVEREEFMNAGVVVYCRQQRFLQAALHVEECRLLALCPTLDVALVRAHLQSFTGICSGAQNAGPIALLEAGARFRWLTAVRSTIVQTSRVHTGYCTDLTVLAGHLLATLVHIAPDA